jgi:hypothetical protein
MEMQLESSFLVNDLADEKAWTTLSGDHQRRMINWSDQTGCSFRLLVTHLMCTEWMQRSWQEGGDGQGDAIRVFVFGKRPSR